MATVMTGETKDKRAGKEMSAKEKLFNKNVSGSRRKDILLPIVP
jgi:hypothetical protein